MPAHQAALSLGFSRQEHWNGLPFPSPMHENENWKWCHLVVSDSSIPHGLQPTRFLHPWDFPDNSTGVGCLHLLCYIPYICVNMQYLLSSFWLTLFCKIQNYFSRREKKKHINYLEKSKSTWSSSLLKKIEFWEDVIMNLPEKWQKVVKQNSEYMVQ